MVMVQNHTQNQCEHIESKIKFIHYVDIVQGKIFQIFNVNPRCLKISFKHLQIFQGNFLGAFLITLWMDNS
jgi:hypothetical protein